MSAAELAALGEQGFLTPKDAPAKKAMDAVLRAFLASFGLDEQSRRASDRIPLSRAHAATDPGERDNGCGFEVLHDAARDVDAL